MGQLMDWYHQSKEKFHPVELAARFHHKFVAIHPFQDGNGRVSRLIMNFILMKAGYPTAIIRQEERIDYYEALEEADRGNDDDFVQLIANEELRSLQIMCQELQRNT
jgi:Fic family protein